MAPVLSIIIPTRNRSDVLRRTAASLLDQAARLAEDTEIIVVDDGSDAQECEAFDRFLAEIGQAADRVRFIRQAASGPAAARNQALRASAGAIVLFLGDDILPCPGLLEAHIIAHRETYPDENVAILGLADLAPEFRDTPFARWWRRRNFRYDALLTGRRQPDISFFFTNNLSLKRDFLLKHGVFDEAFPAAAYEDVELAYRLSQHGLRIVFLPKAGAYHYHRIDLATACRRMETRGRYFDMFWEKTHHPAVSKIWAWAAAGPWMQPVFIRPLWQLARKLEPRMSLGPANVLILMYFFLVGRGLRPPLQ